MLRDGASRAPRPLYQLGYICDQPYFLIVVWTRRRCPTHLHRDDRNLQMKEDPAEYYLGESDTEVLLNTELLEEADQLAEQLETPVDVVQLPSPDPHPY